MNPHPGLARLADWLLNHSLQAAVLVVFVLLLQFLLRRRLTSRWRFALWWIVVARLVLPFGPESAVSLFNYFRPSVSLQSPPAAPKPAPFTLTMHDQEPRVVINLPDSNNSTASDSVRRPDAWLLPAVMGVWAAGAGTLCLCVLVQWFRFRKSLTRSTTPADPAAHRMLEICRAESRVSRPIELLVTDAVGSPALFGLFRLRLLMPEGLIGGFRPDELRYIFLHELAHVKRGDLWLNWLVTALQILHWFNPLLWLGFARLRADRELACDELTLMLAGEKVGTPYGETVIKLLESLSRPAAIPGLIGILEDKQQMRRRISMIAGFRRPGRWSALAAVLVAVVAAAALTDAKTPKPAVADVPAINSPTNTAAATGSSRSSALNPSRGGMITLRDGNSTVTVNLDDTNIGMYHWSVDSSGHTNQSPLPSPNPSHGGTITLRDGNSTATVYLDDTNTGMSAWTVDGVSNLNRQWFWYRVAPTGAATQAESGSVLYGNTTGAVFTLPTSPSQPGPGPVNSRDRTAVSPAGNGRTIVGRFRFDPADDPLDFKHVHASLQSCFSKTEAKFEKLRTEPERRAFLESAEFKEASKDFHDYPAALSSNGTFRVDGVPPGKYEFSVRVMPSDELEPSLAARRFTLFYSAREFVVPAADDQASKAPIEVGAVELKLFGFPIVPGQDPAK